jgi:hypothetical protein
MPGARPERFAGAAIVAGFPSEQAISQRRERVLNDELSLTVTEALRESSKTVSPLRITVRRLVVQRDNNVLT